LPNPVVPEEKPKEAPFIPPKPKNIARPNSPPPASTVVSPSSKIAPPLIPPKPKSGVTPPSTTTSKVTVPTPTTTTTTTPTTTSEIKKKAPPLPVKPKVDDIQELLQDANPPSRPPPRLSEDDGPQEIVVRTSTRTSALLTKGKQELPNLEGFLEKKGEKGVIKSFKKRYFVLRGNRMVYYADETSKFKDDPIGYIPLNNLSSFAQNKSAKPPGQFQVVTQDPERIWQLRAETDEDAQKWVSAIAIHSKYKPPKPKSSVQRLIPDVNSGLFS
jgi:hypothetical protein